MQHLKARIVSDGGPGSDLVRWGNENANLPSSQSTKQAPETPSESNTASSEEFDSRTYFSSLLFCFFFYFGSNIVCRHVSHHSHSASTQGDMYPAGGKDSNFPSKASRKCLQSTFLRPGFLRRVRAPFFFCCLISKNCYVLESWPIHPAIPPIDPLRYPWERDGVWALLSPLSCT